jgi:hypothetical protein
MILFLGDSFTWGQGLHYYSLVEEKGWSWDDCKQFFESNKRFETLGFQVDEFRRRNSFPYLVSKELDMPFQTTKMENGGDNYVLFEMLENLQPFCTPNIIDFIVVQFSSPSRSILNGTEPKLNTIDEQIKLQVSRISDFCNRWKIKWLGISWQEEIGNILKSNYIENFVPIKYKDKEYTHFDFNYNPKLHPLFIQYKENIKDGHFNLEGHKVIAKSIIDKVYSTNYLIKNYK